jgi:hypothetical protein
MYFRLHGFRPVPRRRRAFRPSATILEERRLLSGSAVELIDRNSAGTDASDTGALFPSISADGRYVTYESPSTDLINGLTVTVAMNIYVRDRLTNKTSLVSINMSGTNGGNDSSNDPIISANGNTVVFLSSATDLTANNNPTNNPENKNNVFAWSRATNTLTLVSVNYEGTGPGNDPDTQEFGTAANISVSADGRYVAFQSAATDLVPNIPNINDYTNVYVRDLLTNTTILVSRDVAGTDCGDGPSNNPVISADGSTVAFDSLANNLDPNHTYVEPFVSYQVYASTLRNDAMNTTKLVSIDPTGTTPGNDTSASSSLSYNGQMFAFQSAASNLVSIPVQSVEDVYVRDLATNTTQLASINDAGTADADSSSFAPQISGDGDHVLFYSLADDLTTNNTNGNTNVFERNLTTNTTQLVSGSGTGTNSGDKTSRLANETIVNASQQASGQISDNGRYVLFVSLATNLVPGFVDEQLNDPYYGFDLYLRDTEANTTTLLSHQVGTTTTGGDQISGTADMTPDGGYVAFQSIADNLVPVDNNGQTDVFATPAPFTPAAATQLVISTRPPNSVTAGSEFGLTIEAEDPFGNVVSSFTGKVTISLAAKPVGGTLGGSLTVTAVKGVASFSGLTLNKADSGYALKATSGILTFATTPAFTVTPAAASQLVISTPPPSSVTAGSGFGLTIRAEDSFGNVVSSFTGKISIAMAANPGGSTLGGTLAVTAVKGVASFSGLTLNKVGSGYALKATSGSLTAATTTAFTVTSAAASQLVVSSQPPSSVTAGSGFGLTITVEDRFGNVVSSFTGKVTIALAANPSGSTLGGTLTVTAVKGLATFSGLTLNKPGNGYRLKTTSSGLTSATTSAFNVK